MTEVQTIDSVIITYRREQVLIETIEHLLRIGSDCSGFRNLIVVDQTETHEPATQEQLQSWDEAGTIQWIKLDRPHLTHAMNVGWQHATSDLVLFTDDDIIPRSNLYQHHLQAHREHDQASAVVGQILQPGESAVDADYRPSGSFLRRYLDFPFNSNQGVYIENAMAGNLSLKRLKAFETGGFDENFPPPVAARFESEFAKRIIRGGGKIWFCPEASLDHLAASTGGVRSRGSHLTSASAHWGVGDYYFALKTGKGWARLLYILRKPLREVATKFHLRHPWWIPVKLLGEAKAFILAMKLYGKLPQEQVNDD